MFSTIATPLSDLSKLSQEHETGEQPIAYYCRNFSPQEINYSATEKEGLAVVDSLKPFLYYLIGRHFHVITDHRALQFMTNKEPSSRRIVKWFDTMRDLDFMIHYHPGPANDNADGPSRPAWEG